MAKNIFDSATDGMVMGYKQSIPQFISNGGYLASEIRGPNLFTFEVPVHTVATGSAAYKGIMKDIRDMQYGAKTAQVAINNPAIQGDGSFLGTIKVSGAGQSGSTIQLKGALPNGVGELSDGDVIQFHGHTKVFVVEGDYNADSGGNLVDADTGVLGVKLNTPLFASPADDELVRHGKDCVFNLVMTSTSSTSHSVQGSESNLVQFREFSFMEVINA